MDVELTIEIPKGQRNKYEVDHATGRITARSAVTARLHVSYVIAALLTKTSSFP